MPANKRITVEKDAFDGLLARLLQTKPIKSSKIKTRGDRSKGKPILAAPAR